MRGCSSMDARSCKCGSSGTRRKDKRRAALLRRHAQCPVQWKNKKSGTAGSLKSSPPRAAKRPPPPGFRCPGGKKQKPWLGDFLPGKRKSRGRERSPGTGPVGGGKRGMDGRI